MIRLSIPSIETDDLDAVHEVLKSGFLVQGTRVAAFEQKVADLVETKYAIAVSNGTATLHLALLALDVRAGDIVITTAYSWLSTANVIELVGATPIFTDIDPRTFNMSPSHLAEVIENLMTNRSTASRVKAIMPVHTFGQMADMPAILEIANKYNIPVVEDAACALGATLNGVQAGRWGVMGSFSFHPRKAVTTGEGGIITTNSDEYAWKIKALRNHGLDPNSSTPSFVMPGFNYRMTDFQGALGETQLNKLKRIISARKAGAQVYDQLLENSNLTVPITVTGIEHIYQSYVCLLPKAKAVHRKEIISVLKTQGIETNIGTWNMPLTDYYAKRYGYKRGDFPTTDNVFEQTLTLPLFEGISAAQQINVIAKIIDLLENI